MASTFDEQSTSTDHKSRTVVTQPFEAQYILFRVNYSQYNIIHEVFCYEYVYDEAKTTTGLEIGLMPISDVLFRQRKQKGQKNGISCNATIFADSNNTKSDVFQTMPTFQAVSRWTWVETHQAVLQPSRKPLSYDTCILAWNIIRFSLLAQRGKISRKKISHDKISRFRSKTSIWRF